MTREQAAAMPLPGQGGATGRIVRSDFPDPNAAPVMVDIIDNTRCGTFLVRDVGGVEYLYSAAMSGWTTNRHSATRFGSAEEAMNVLGSLPFQMQMNARPAMRDFSVRTVAA